jgi:quercetin dioxygenase-like cupin family protein
MSEAHAARWIQLAPGVKRMTVAVGEQMMQVAVKFDAGAKVPEHAHVHEQIAAILTGKLRLIVDGEAHDLQAGQSFTLKSNVPHSAEALEETWILDTFSPPREDMLKVDREQA